MARDKNDDEDRRVPNRVERHHPVSRGEIHAEDVSDQAARAHGAKL